MPIYDYTCSACSRLTEVIHGINDHGPRFCPECGAEGTMRKGFGLPAVHFKGSGWAKKDRSSSAKPAKSKDEAAPSAEGSSSAKDDASAEATPKSSGGTSESTSKTTTAATTD